MKTPYNRFCAALIVSCFVAVGLLSGCQNKAPSDPTPAGEPQMGKEVDLDKLPTLEVPDDGTKFDPSVPVAQLPEGAWTCDMGGLSHYAAMHKKDGKCPICHMDLVEVTADPEK